MDTQGQPNRGRQVRSAGQSLKDITGQLHVLQQVHSRNMIARKCGGGDTDVDTPLGTGTALFSWSVGELRMCHIRCRCNPAFRQYSSFDALSETRRPRRQITN